MQQITQQKTQKPDQNVALSRRLALGMGTAAAGGLLVAHTAFAEQNNYRESGGGGANYEQGNELPVDQMQNIIGAPARMTHGLLHFSIERKDLKNVTGSTGPNLRGPRIPLRPAFAINGDFFFQRLGNNQAIFNGDFAFRPEEVDSAIDAMLRNGLEFQALHQHLMDVHPAVFFMHFRGTGAPVALAHGIAKVLSATATPLPQHRPSNPQTPFDHDRLGHILGGSATVGGDGTVAVLVPRRNREVLAGVGINPYLNIATNVYFEPLDSQGQKAAVLPDFAMTVNEITPVMRTMRRQGWAVHCLYNQETAEQPQLYFSHQLKVGNPYQLAEEIRHGLNQTDAVHHSRPLAQRG